jgi:hypothetical protein
VSSLTGRTPASQSSSNPIDLPIGPQKWRISALGCAHS